MIVSVSYSPPSNSSTAEHHFFSLLPGPDNTEQPEGEWRQLSLSIRAKPTDLPQRQQSILPASCRTDIASPRTHRDLCRLGEERGCRYNNSSCCADTAYHSQEKSIHHCVEETHNSRSVQVSLFVVPFICHANSLMLKYWIRTAIYRAWQKRRCIQTLTPPEGSKIKC